MGRGGLIFLSTDTLDSLFDPGLGFTGITFSVERPVREGEMIESDLSKGLDLLLLLALLLCDVRA